MMSVSWVCHWLSHSLAPGETLADISAPAESARGTSCQTSVPSTRADQRSLAADHDHRDEADREQQRERVGADRPEVPAVEPAGRA